MKKTLLFLLLAISMSGLAQSVAKSAPITVNIVKEIVPAILDIIPSSIEFVDASKNNAIDANETCYIKFKVRNTGKGDGIGCKTRVVVSGNSTGLTINTVNLPTIYAGQTQEVQIPIKANMSTQDGIINLRFEVTEPQGFGTDVSELTVATKAFVNPMLQIVDYSITSSTGSSQLKKKAPFDLQLMLQNTKYGRAEDVSVRITLPSNVYMTDGQELNTFASIEGGSAKSLVYSLIVTNNYVGSTIPIEVELKEKYGKYAESKTINLQLNQTMASNKIIVDEVQQERQDIEIALIGSAVDRNIPITTQVNKNTFAIIIANENYKHVASVPFARNDGEIFRQYCMNTLGIPQSHIKYVNDATLNDISSNIKWLQGITDAWDVAPNVIVYYAGHGIPDEGSRSAYILPVDGSGTDVSTGYSLDNLYYELGQMSAAQITVFMDACFSGSSRNNTMLASARGVALKAKAGSPQGNMVVFSAAQGDETAYPSNQESHGMFTYYLLKRLQETSGDVTLQDLGDYITKNVRQQSILLNDKSQTPCVTASSMLGTDWQTWKLK